MAHRTRVMPWNRTDITYQNNTILLHYMYTVEGNVKELWKSKMF